MSLPATIPPPALPADALAWTHVLAATLEHLPDPVALLDADGKVLAINGAWRTLPSDHPFVGHHLGVGTLYPLACATARGVDPDAAQQMVAGLAQVAAGQVKAWQVEYTFARGSERLIYMANMRHFRVADQGFAVVTHHDLTERRWLEEARRRTDAYYRLLVETARDGMMTLDARGRIETINRAAEAIFGYRAREIVGQSVQGLLAAEPGVDIADLLHGEPATPPRRLWGRRKNGTAFPMEWSSNKVPLGGKRVYLVILRDVTQLHQAETARTDLLRRLVHAQEDERAHLARDLHDGVCQTLMSLNLGLRAIGDAPTLTRAWQLAERFGEVADQALQELRRLSHGLRPAVLDDLGLPAALERLVRELEATCSLAVAFHVAVPPDERWPRAVETTLYRIAQESLANVLKHAHARQVQVTLDRTSDLARLAVADDGVGFAATREAWGFGLSSLDERAKILNGTLIVESRPGHGTLVAATFPLGAPGDAENSRDAGR
jgi:PAS domain S-box-containing protein